MLTPVYKDIIVWGISILREMPQANFSLVRILSLQIN